MLRRRSLVGWVVLVLAVAGAAFWAGTVVGRPEVKPLDQPTTSLYTVVSGQVGRELGVSVTATWPSGRPVLAAGAGTVTTIEVRNGQTIDTGDRLLSVDLQPSFVAVGAVPAFRDITPAVHGADVLQWQQMLAKLGYSVRATGVHDTASVAATKQWQAKVGLPGDGVVHRGQVTFTPQLPIRVALPKELTVGSEVSAGSTLATVITGNPTFAIVLSSEQTKVIPQNGRVKISHDGGNWEGKVSASTQDRQSGEVTWTVTAAAGGVVCGTECASVPVPGPTTLQGAIVAVPVTKGPVVPAASILSAPDGSAAVVRADGTQEPISILGTSGGLSVVKGVEVGDQIQLFAQSTS